MHSKQLINAVFIAASILSLVFFFAVPIGATSLTWDSYVVSGQRQVFVGGSGEVYDVESSPLQSNQEIVAVNWTTNGNLIRQNLLKVSSDSVSVFSSFDGSNTWLMTPAEPILELPLQAGKTWRWQGSVTIGEETYPSRMQYSVGQKRGVTVGGREREAFPVVAYGWIGDALVVKERLFAPGVGLVEEQTVISRDGRQEKNWAKLQGLR